MTTDKCAVTIAEGKHGDFAEQNHVNASLGFHACALISLETTLTVKHLFAEHYRSICTDMYACLSTSQSHVYWQNYTFRKSIFPELTHSLSNCM